MSAAPRGQADASGPRFAWWVVLVGLLVVSPIFWVLFRGLGMDPHRMDAPLVGKAAPPFELPRLEDEQNVTLQSLQGKPVVLNFWATWCVPCRQEHPVLLRGAKEYGDAVQFVGVVYQDKRETVQAWLERYGGVGYPTLIDIGGKTSIAYGVYGVPETFFIDRNGVIVDKFVGPMRPSDLHRAVQGIL